MHHTPAGISRRSILTTATTASGAAALSALGVTTSSTTSSAAFPSTTTTAAPAPRPRVDHYTTAPRAELVATLARVVAKPYRFTTLYSLRLPDLRAGDVVQAHGQFEVTNDLGFNVMIAHAMLVHRTETIVTHGDRPAGRFISEYAGENVTPDMHHAFRTLVGSFAAESAGDAWLSLVIYAASDSPKSGETLRVEQGYGGLRAIVFRNA